jgi:hypothetical protein
MIREISANRSTVDTSSPVGEERDEFCQSLAERAA